MQEGTRVRTTEESGLSEETRYGVIKTVDEDDTLIPYCVRFDDENYSTWVFAEDIEEVTEQEVAQ